VDKLWTKCQKNDESAQFSNADNMAVIGVLSTQILHRGIIAAPPSDDRVTPKTLIERLEAKP
jgi:asparagine synthase (glutamine-hydrolysing)